uniref:Protein NEDD1-like n=1 Tax=Diabrotica virgifera virgifera TaxID=50390 RepID=A0A6P7FV14_DIAVI
MTLATSSKDIRLYKWPNITYIGLYETPIDCMLVKSISWSCDGKEILAVKSKGCPVIVDVYNKNDLNLEAYECSFINHASVGVFLNTDPDKIAFGTDEGFILIYNVKHARRPQDFLKLQSSIQYLDFSADDQLLAAGCSNGTIVLLNSSYTPCASFLISGSHTLSNLCYNKICPNLLAGASKEGVLSVWNTETTDNLFISKQHAARITDLAFFNNGLSSVGIDRKFVTYDLRSFKASCYELDCPLSSLSYLDGTYELAVSTTTGQLRSYDSRNMKSPLRTLVAIANGGIKKISFPMNPDVGVLGYTDRRLEDDFSASGDFSIASGSSPRRSNACEKYMKLGSPTTADTDTHYMHSPKKYFTSSKYEDLNKFIEDKLKVATRDFEEKLIQTFYKLRINTSKKFVSVEDKISQNWNNFVDYLKFSGQGATGESEMAIQRYNDEVDDQAGSNK